MAAVAEEKLVDVLFSVQSCLGSSRLRLNLEGRTFQYSWLSHHLGVGGGTPALLTRRPALEKPCRFMHGQKSTHLPTRSECSCESDRDFLFWMDSWDFCVTIILAWKCRSGSLLQKHIFDRWGRERKLEQFITDRKHSVNAVITLRPYPRSPHCALENFGLQLYSSL